MIICGQCSERWKRACQCVGRGGLLRCPVFLVAIQCRALLIAEAVAEMNIPELHSGDVSNTQKIDASVPVPWDDEMGLHAFNSLRRADDRFVKDAGLGLAPKFIVLTDIQKLIK
jgi:hypothetical protein